MIDEPAIRALVQRATEAQNDPDAFIPLHTPDAVIVNFFGRRVLGRDALEEAMGAALSSPFRDVRTEIEVVDIRPVTEDVAVVSCIKTVHDERDAGGDDLPASTGALTYVVSQVEGSWRIAVAQTTPIRA